MPGYKGQCMCGAVKFEVPSEPFAMLVCHCIDCRAWSASPVNGATAYKRDQLSIKKGEDLIKRYTSSESHNRCWCSVCGGHVFSDHPAYDLVDVYASVLEGLAFKPGAHVHYAQSILPIKDGLPKFKDFPAELGGSGEMMDE